MTVKMKLKTTGERGRAMLTIWHRNANQRILFSLVLEKRKRVITKGKIQQVIIPMKVIGVLKDKSRKTVKFQCRHLGEIRSFVLVVWSERQN